MDIIFCDFHFIDFFLLVLRNYLGNAVLRVGLEIFVELFMSVLADKVVNDPD